MSVKAKSGLGKEAAQSRSPILAYCPGSVPPFVPSPRPLRGPLLPPRKWHFSSSDVEVHTEPMGGKEGGGSSDQSKWCSS